MSKSQERNSLDGFSGGSVLTSPAFSMRLITPTDRPHGRCILLTSEGIAVIGTYDGNPKHYLAYSPLPNLTPEIKEVLYARSTSGRIPDHPSVD